MKCLAFINAIDITPHASAPLPDGTNAIQAVFNFSRQLPDLAGIVLLTGKKLDPALIPDSGAVPVTQVTQATWSLQELLKTMADTLQAEAADHLYYFYADCPFLNKSLTERMYRNHLRYFADYTFADGYPYGLSPEIIKKETLSLLQRQLSTAVQETGNALQERFKITRASFFDLIKKDINNYDLETEISPVDLRLLRLSLTTDTKRNFLLVKRLLEVCPPAAAPAGLSEEKILATIQEHPEILRTLPAFFNIQIVEGCLQNCSYCPYPARRGERLGKTGELAPEDFEKIINRITDFCEDAVISLSLWGEPALHSRLYELLCTVLKNNTCTLLIETSGLGFREELLQRLKEDWDQGKIASTPTWIVSLDAINQASYIPLRGEGLPEARAFIDTLLKIFPREQVYVQAVRMKENEDELEQFYRYWKAARVQFIIQKYDDFCGKLPERRVTDLSPLKRFPCWHLKRDLNILLNGDVPLCREDLGCAHPAGNILQSDLKQIWAKAEAWYLEQTASRYLPLCEHCDEYYTYNY